MESTSHGNPPPLKSATGTRVHPYGSKWANLLNGSRTLVFQRPATARRMPIPLEDRTHSSIPSRDSLTMRTILLFCIGSAME